MPSSYSASFRLNLQAPGENLNTWGTILNNGVFQLLEDAVAGMASFTLSGPRALTSTNGATDEARCAVLNVTGGTGGTITAPSVKKVYLVRNASSGPVIITTGSGVTATFSAGEVGFCAGDGTNFYRVVQTDMAGLRLTSLGTPTANTDAATKQYVDNTAFAMAAGSLPGQTGNAGKSLVTDGSNASWQDPSITIAQITDYASDQAAKTDTATKLAVAFAAAL